MKWMDWKGQRYIYHYMGKKKRGTASLECRKLPHNCDTGKDTGESADFNDQSLWCYLSTRFWVWRKLLGWGLRGKRALWAIVFILVCICSCSSEQKEFVCKYHFNPIFWFLAIYRLKSWRYWCVDVFWQIITERFIYLSIMGKKSN